MVVGHHLLTSVAAVLSVGCIAIGCGGDEKRGHQDAAGSSAHDGASSGAGAGAASGAGDVSGAGAAGAPNGVEGAPSASGAGGTSGSDRGDTGDSGRSPVAQSSVGTPCASADECPPGGSGTAVCLLDWPGGYCAVAGCTPHGHDCPNDPGQGSSSTRGGKCVLAPSSQCLALCATTADCRDGYSCQAKDDSAGHGSANVCVPESASSGAEGPAGAAMGGADTMTGNGSNGMMGSTGSILAEVGVPSPPGRGR